MADDAAEPGLLAVLRHAARTALGVGALAALVDLWQVALTNPAAISASSLLVLVGIYVGVSLAVAGAVLLAVWLTGPRRLDDAARVVPPALIAGWAFFLAQGVVLRALPSTSAWRVWSVGALAAVALLAIPALAAVARRVRMPGWTVALVWLLVGAGAVGAVRGFRGPGREPAPPGAGTAAGGEDRPNVILITVDTLRADHLSCYGYPRLTSPMIDAFAAEGVLFSRAYSQSSWTKPATASLLTSQFPSMHRTVLEQSRIPDDVVLLPEALHDAGYLTAVLSGNPWVTTEYGFNQGVDYFYSIYDERFARVTLLMPALKRANDLAHLRVYNTVKRLVQGEESTTARDERLSAAAARWLTAHTDRRFFLYLHMMSPHHPYDPPPPYDRVFVKHPQVPPVTNYPRKSYFFGEEGEALPTEKLDDMVGRYDGAIRYGDTVLGKLFGTLRDLGLLDRSVVILTADHGEEFYDHKNWGHGHSMYDELLHVPLIVRFPAKFPAGMRVESPVMTVDVMPTALELAGATTTATLAGHSLVPLVAGDPAAHPPEAFAELLYRYGTGRALIEGDKKLIELSVDGDVRREMYDVKADPAERWNVVPAEAPELMSRLSEVASWAERHRVDAAEVHVTGEMEHRVKALGYVN